MNYMVVKAWFDGDDLPCLEVAIQDVPGVLFSFEGIEADVKDSKLQCWYQLVMKKNDASELPEDFEDLASEVLHRIWSETVAESKSAQQNLANDMRTL
jgi:hypothetical protein